MRSIARGQSNFFKSALLIVLVSQVMGSVSSFPQLGVRWFNFVLFILEWMSGGNVQFPSNQQNISPSANPLGKYPVDETGNIHHSSQREPVPSDEFQVGTTGIKCDSPGTFVKAPDGCNRCFCAENGQLSSACSRVFCPPGFPSSSLGQQARALI